MVFEKMILGKTLIWDSDTMYRPGDIRFWNASGEKDRDPYEVWLELTGGKNKDD